MFLVGRFWKASYAVVSVLADGDIGRLFPIVMFIFRGAQFLNKPGQAQWSFVGDYRAVWLNDSYYLITDKKLGQVPTRYS